MRHLRSFNESNIDKKEFPWDGHELSARERKIITDLVGIYLSYKFNIRVDDHYYYVNNNGYYNVFENFNELIDYIRFWYYIEYQKQEDLLNLFKTSKLDPSTDYNFAIRWAGGYKNKEIVKFLLKDERVRDKLTDSEINKYNKIITE